MLNIQYISSLINGQTLNPKGSNLVIAEWVAEGTNEGCVPELIAPLHKHIHDDEAWYILKGTLGFKIGDKEMEASSGHAVIIPSGTPHTYWNPRPDQAKYLIIMSSKINSLIESIHNTTQRDLESMKELFRKYDSELL